MFNWKSNLFESRQKVNPFPFTVTMAPAQCSGLSRARTKITPHFIRRSIPLSGIAQTQEYPDIPVFARTLSLVFPGQNAVHHQGKHTGRDDARRDVAIERDLEDA